MEYIPESDIRVGEVKYDIENNTMQYIIKGIIYEATLYYKSTATNIENLYKIDFRIKDNNIEIEIKNRKMIPCDDMNLFMTYCNNDDIINICNDVFRKNKYTEKKVAALTEHIMVLPESTNTEFYKKLIQKELDNSPTTALFQVLDWMCENAGLQLMPRTK